MSEVPAIIVTGLDERKRRALIIADNKLALNSTWDEEALKVELEDLASDFGQLIGFSEEELVNILGEAKQEFIDDFKDIGETILEHKCPKCGFEFNE